MPRKNTKKQETKKTYENRIEVVITYVNTKAPATSEQIINTLKDHAGADDIQIKSIKTFVHE